MRTMNHGPDERHELSKGELFPVVGVGASAGGLEAFTQLLEALPQDTGMGFVLVQHLDSEHENALAQILARATALPVREVTNDEQVLANHIYVIAHGTSLSIVNGVLKLQPRLQTHTSHRPIDSFFESLAQDRRQLAVGVVLSGAAADGTLGLEAIKAEGGITFAQDDSAKYDSMPKSAVAAGCVDIVLSPAKIAKELARIAKHPYVTGQPSLSAVEDAAASIGEGEGEGEDEDTPMPSGDRHSPAQAEKVLGELERGHGSESKESKGASGYKKILLLLRNHSGVDFSLYKFTTIHRRVARRLVLNKQNTLEDYADFLRCSSMELDALYSDVLISVTSFFRNPETFDSLQHKVLGELLKQRGDGPLRCWVLGCSSGQEAYSIAIAFTEAAERAHSMRPLQIFATDLKETLLDQARRGFYARSLVDGVTPERLQRFFVKEGGGYRVSKMLRQMVVFARQNLIADPPFSRMDLVSCRNLLIYLEASLQKKAMPTFHYALKPGGFLLLGASETVGGFTDLFEPVDKKHKIYSKRAGLTPAFHLPLKTAHGDKAFGSRPPLLLRQPGHLELPESGHGELNARREADRITANKFAPPAVLVDAKFQVLQFRGSTNAFLEPPTGRATFDVLKMARNGLMLPLRSALSQVTKEGKTARKENVRVDRNGTTGTVNLEVIPLKNLPERCFLILFEETEQADRSDGRTRSAKAIEPPEKVVPLTAEQESSRIVELETEVSDAREYLQSVQEQHEAANEELQAANEEIQSANEELQSVNEELETSKEELESVNEELITVNDEMSHRNVELNRLNNDLTNFQASTKLAVVLLGRDLTIRRFSPEAEKQFDLLVGDVGRPISHIRHSLVLGDDTGDTLDLENVSARVISEVREQECEVRNNRGRWYLMRVRPYLTADSKLDGAVLVLVDITDRKRAEEAPARLAAIVTSSDDAIISKDLQGIIQTWNAGATRLFGYTEQDAIGRPATLLMPPNRVNEEPGILGRVQCGETVDHYETVRQRKDGSLLDVSLTVSPIRDAAGRVIGTAKIARDVTRRKRIEALLDLQRRALQLLAENAPLDDVLGFLVSAVERCSPAGTLASIVPLNATGAHFQRGIGASLPDAFHAAVEGAEVSSPSSLCAYAVRRREEVTVRDFNQDAVWQPFFKVVAPYGLRSGWSVPIVAANGKVLGSFANYYRQAGDPTPQDRELVDMVLRTAAVAIERKRAEEALQQSYAELRLHTEALGRFNRVAVGRELRMMELKNEVNELSVRQGEGARYAPEFVQETEGADPPEPAPNVHEAVRPGDSLVSLEEILCTEVLNERPSRAPDYETENRALVALISALGDSPRVILQTLAETVRNVLNIDSAGLSLLTQDGRKFYWPAIAGMWKPHIGGGTSRDFGPCGDVLDCNGPLLFKHWERRYPYLVSATPFAEEGLVVPFYVDGKAVGTIWAIAHDDRRKFDREDLRQLESLGRFTSAAYQAVERKMNEESARAALNLMEDAVAARKAMETITVEAREREDRLRFTLEATQVGEWDLDLATDMAHRSPRHDQIFGYDALLSEWGYQILLKHLHPEDRVSVEQSFNQAVAEGKSWQVECRIIRADQAVRWIWVNGIVHRDQSGKAQRMSGLVMDITERRRMENELRKYGADLVEADYRKNEFLAMLGHELRNPLSAIAHGLDLQGRIQDDSARSDELHGMMVRQTKRIGTLLDQLLDVSRVISGKVDLSQDRVDLPGVVRAALETVRPLVELQKHQLTLALPPAEGVFVMGDAVRLTQIVENLVTNAVKYTDAGGQIKVVLEWGRDEVRLIVRDTGMGIDAEFLPHVFAVFTQAPRALDRAKGGLGLGLPLVRRLVEMHGGQIEASSRGAGQGSDFIVTLPLSLERSSKEGLKGETAPAEPCEIPLRRILIVDNEEDAAEMLAGILEKNGHQTLAVSDGLAALSAVGTFGPEIVLLDIGLPQMDGYEVARRLREVHSDRNILLVALTGYQRDEARLKRAGFDEHLLKPLSMKKLSAVLAAWDRAGKATS